MHKGEKATYKKKHALLVAFPRIFLQAAFSQKLLHNGSNVISVSHNGYDAEILKYNYETIESEKE